MNRNIHHSQIIFLCFFLLVLVGCHNNAHLRTQKVLKPGEKAYSASGVVATGSETRYGRLDYTGVPGIRGEVSMLTGREGGEAGPYFGIGLGSDEQFGYVGGFEYKQYRVSGSGAPKKLGIQGELNYTPKGDWGAYGSTLHFRPSFTTTTTKEKYFYSGIHGLLARGSLVKGYGYGDDISYNFNSLGLGITAGVEYLLLSSSIQIQIDASLLRNTYTSAEYSYVGRYDDDEPSQSTFLLTGSAGVSFFNPLSLPDAPLEPYPVPYDTKPQPIITYDPETGKPTTETSPEFDPETGEKISGGMRFDPETGEAIVEKQTGYKFVDDTTVETQLNPKAGTRGTTLSQLEIQSLALVNARQKHVGPGWGLLGLAGCGTGLMGGIIGGEMADFPGFILGGALGLSLPSLFASGTASSSSVLHYPAEIKTQNGKQLYKDAYVKETGRLRMRSTVMGTGVGLLGFGAFMLVLISSF
jgi:hypothetical protein